MSDWGPGELGTLGSIRSNVQSWEDSGRSLARAKEFYNCVEQPLFNGPDSTLVLEILPVPELHILLGPTNDLVKHFSKRWNQEKGNCNQSIFACALLLIIKIHINLSIQC